MSSKKFTVEVFGRLVIVRRGNEIICDGKTQADGVTLRDIQFVILDYQKNNRTRQAVTLMDRK